MLPFGFLAFAFVLIHCGHGVALYDYGHVTSSFQQGLQGQQPVVEQYLPFLLPKY